MSREHRGHRSTIAITSWRNRRVSRPRCSYASATLFAILLRSVRSLCALCTLSLRPRYDQCASTATVLFRHSQPWRFCHASVTLLAFWPNSGRLKLVSLLWILEPTLLRISSSMSGSIPMRLNLKNEELSSFKA